MSQHADNQMFLYNCISSTLQYLYLVYKMMCHYIVYNRNTSHVIKLIAFATDGQCVFLNIFP